MEPLQTKIIYEMADMGEVLIDDSNIMNIEKNFVEVLEEPNIVNVSNWVMELKWYINLIFVGLPWVLFSWLMAWYNIIINAWINKGWALGNIWLMSNTFFCMF